VDTFCANTIVNQSVIVTLVINKWSNRPSNCHERMRSYSATLLKSWSLYQLLLAGRPVIENIDSTATGVDVSADRGVETGQAVHVVSISQGLFHTKFSKY